MNNKPDTGHLSLLGVEMLNLCRRQLANTIEAFLKQDFDLAENVIHMDKRVDALYLKIDRDCEEFLALHKPVGSNFKFVLALRKITFDLKRIEYYSLGISRYTVSYNMLPNKKILESLRLHEMFSITISMLEDIIKAFSEKASKRAHKVFKKEGIINEINLNTPELISKLVKNEVDLINHYLLLFTIINKVETIGNLITNIAQEIIFYREAEGQK